MLGKKANKLAFTQVRTKSHKIKAKPEIKIKIFLFSCNINNTRLYNQLCLCDKLQILT